MVGSEAVNDVNLGVAEGWRGGKERGRKDERHANHARPFQRSRSGSERFRGLKDLSIGQQCTAISHLLLLDNPDPLIMDQPEDNLDNAVIAERIVKELRSAKTERQFLFATHNANIPVFGDAERIGVCTATGDRAEMPPHMQVSIDIPEIRDQAASILEGGKEAFTQRREKYGFDYQ